MVKIFDLRDYEEEWLFENVLLKTYFATWKNKILYQDLYGIFTLLRGISIIAMKSNIMIQTKSDRFDPRIPLIYFSDSGSGKGMGNDFYSEVFGENGVGLKIRTLKEPTNEVLIGSIDSSIDSTNKKKSLKEGDAKYVDPIIRGYLELYDDIVFEESEKLFNTQEGEKKLKTARVALDKYGSQTNLLSSETLKNNMGHRYYCKCNVMILTYHVQGIAKCIIENGIFQRNICLFNRLTRYDIKDIIRGKMKGRICDIERGINIIKAELKKLNDYINSNYDEGYITVTEDAENYANDYCDQKLDYYYMKGEDIGEAIKSFFPRLVVLLNKVACSFSLIKRKQIVGIQEMKESCIVVDIAFESMVEQLIINGLFGEEKKKIYHDCKKVLGTRYRSKSLAYDTMATYWNVCNKTVRSRIKKIYHLFDEKKGKEGNTILIRLT